MYYCWMIRHLDGNPWTDRIDDPAHVWLLDENRKDEKFMRMTTGQALVKFLDNQYVLLMVKRKIC